MEPNLRDTPLRRFNTFFWGLALFLIFAISAILFKNFLATDEADTEMSKGKERVILLNKIKAEQNAERNTYKDNSDGTVKVMPEDVFGLGKEMGLLDPPKASEKNHGREFK